ncbi:MFS transporter [Phyllobacterium calauticae]|uniref:hypothetical protein n=1 Tax=Phyllobacterium calauticae TaxID=2817027 RepID=UPI001CBD3BB8|nr:hypothetical protein [Phyllobacterium calauticae]
MTEQRFGMIGACFGLGFIAGPLLGGIAGGFGIHYPFLLAMALNGVNFLLALFFLPETSKGVKTLLAVQNLNPLGGFRWATGIKNLTPLIVVFTLMQLVGQIPALQSIITRQVDETRLGEVQGILASATSLTGIIGPVAFTAIYAATRTDWSGFVWISGAMLYIPCVPLLRAIAYRRAAGPSGA